MNNNEKLVNIAKFILGTLSKNGFQAYMVGGFVRDFIRGLATQDIDIATSAKPDEVIQLFERTIPTGLQHGTVTVRLHGQQFEVTTFRTEGHYEDHRRPDEVSFVQSIEEDLSRRDFTMNAMAMDMHGDIIDPFGGQADLHANRLQCVGDPSVRFAEDALRMLRCIRFAANYHLIVEVNTWTALIENGHLLRHIAMERIRIELEKIIEGSNPVQGVYLLAQSQLLAHSKSQGLSQLQFTESVINHWPVQLLLPEYAEMRWTLIFIKNECEPDTANGWMRELTFSNDKRKRIYNVLMMYEWMASQDWTGLEADDMKCQWITGAIKFGKETAAGAIPFIESLASSSNLHVLRQNAQVWLDNNHIFSPADLQVNGQDIISLAGQAGPVVRRVLEQLVIDTALGKVKEDHDSQLQAAHQYVAEWRK